jgi:hypothetical protein
MKTDTWVELMEIVLKECLLQISLRAQFSMKTDTCVELNDTVLKDFPLQFSFRAHFLTIKTDRLNNKTRSLFIL